MRSVVAIRLSDEERGQIAAAARGLGLSLSGFVREAALQASVKDHENRFHDPPAVVSQSSGLVVVGVDDEERWHVVDGERVRRLR